MEPNNPNSSNTSSCKQTHQISNYSTAANPKAYDSKYSKSKYNRFERVSILTLAFSSKPCCLSWLQTLVFTVEHRAARTPKFTDNYWGYDLMWTRTKEQKLKSFSILFPVRSCSKILCFWRRVAAVFFLKLMGWWKNFDLQFLTSYLSWGNVTSDLQRPAEHGEFFSTHFYEKVVQ